MLKNIIFQHGECSYPLAAYGHGWEEDPNDFNSYSVESFPNDEVNANGMNNGESKRNGNVSSPFRLSLNYKSFDKINSHLKLIIIN